MHTLNSRNSAIQLCSNFSPLLSLWGNLCLINKTMFIYVSNIRKIEMIMRMETMIMMMIDYISHLLSVHLLCNKHFIQILSFLLF